MGKVVSILCKTASPLVCLSNPMVGLVLAGTTAISDIIQADRKRRTLNNAIEFQLMQEQNCALRVEEHRLQENLAIIRKLYDENYYYVLSSKEVMTEYYLSIKHELTQENIVIENLEQVLDLLDACAHESKENDAAIIITLNKFSDQIMVLLHWGLMHLNILAGRESSYQHILTLTKAVLDCSELDFLGHSMLEYSYLLGDLNLTCKFKNISKLFQKNQEFKLTQIDFIQKIIHLNPMDLAKSQELLACIAAKQYDVVNCLIVLDKLPSDGSVIIDCIKVLFKLDKHELLEKLLKSKAELITLALIDELNHELHNSYSYSKEYSLNRLKLFYWLNKNNFSDLTQFHPITQETPLEFALTKGNKENFIHLLRCKADPAQINANGDNILILAIKSSKVDIVDYLIKKHKIDPFQYNNQGINAWMILSSYHDNFKEIIKYIASNYSKNYYKFADETKKIVLSTLNYSELLFKIRTIFNLWAETKMSSMQARMPIILGLYLSGIKTILPWGEKELEWLAKKLGFKVKLLPCKDKYNYATVNATEIEITLTSNGYSAKWENGSLELAEADLHYVDLYAHNLCFMENDDLATSSYSVDNNLILLRLILSQNNNSSQLGMSSWIQEQFYFQRRRDELPDGALIEAKKIDNLATDFKYYYEMPNIDAGYHALGISRITAAKLLLINLNNHKILNYIQVEWTNWLMNFYRLPVRLAKIEAIATKFKNYHIALEQFKQFPGDEAKSVELSLKIADLYDLANPAYCLDYIIRVIAVPHNHCNSLQYYSAKGYLPTGGSLIALAEILKINIKIWQINSNLECDFNYEVYEPRCTLNLLKSYKETYTLAKVALLSQENNLTLRKVVTHSDLFASKNVEDDLNVIIHGFFLALNSFQGMMPENDLLSLLLQVKLQQSNQDISSNLLREIKKYRDILSEELLHLFFYDIKTLEFKRNEWVVSAEYRIKEIARKALLQQHYKLIQSYKDNKEILQEKISLEFEDKIKQLEQNNIQFIENFTKSLDKLKKWHDFQIEQALFESANHKKKIKETINSKLQHEHKLIKQKYQKSVKNMMLDFLIKFIAVKLPAPSNFAAKFFKNVVVGAVKSNLKNEKFDFKVINNLVCDEFFVDLPKYNFAKDLVKNLMAGFWVNGECNNLFRNTILIGIQSIYDYGLKHHLKFSDNYVKAIIAGGIEGLCDGLKNDKLSLETMLQKISQHLAKNIKIEPIPRLLNNSVKSRTLKPKDHSMFLSDLIESNTKVNSNFPQSIVKWINEYWFNLYAHAVKSKYNLSEVISHSKNKFPKLAAFLAQTNQVESSIDTALTAIKATSKKLLDAKVSKIDRDLAALDLAVSRKIILSLHKLGLSSLSVGVNLLPGSVNEIRENILSSALSSELYFMYKVGEEFKVPGTDLKMAPLKNNVNFFPGKLYHNSNARDYKNTAKNLHSKDII